MRITTAVLVLTSLLLLAGCNQRDAADVGIARTGGMVSAPAGASLPEALPQGFALDFPYHYTGQEIVRAGKAKRQRITVEFLDGDVNSILGSLAQSALTAGFSKGLWGVQNDGSIQFVADKPGYGQLRAQIRPAGSESLRNPAAKGTLVMGWPVTQTRPSSATIVPAVR
jgi:hypothetical protein